MDDVEQRIDAVLQNRKDNCRKSKCLSPQTKFLLLCVVMLSLGTIAVLPLFDDKSLLSHIETILESKENNNPLVAAQSTNVSPFNYIPSFVGFGTPITIQMVNWTFIEERFNYSVECDGANYTNSLYVNWSYYSQYKKISYEWFATVKGYYYFNITFDSDANNLEYLDGNLTCNYSDGDLFFDINDIIALPVDVDYEIIDDVFYLYIGADIKNKNTQVSIDPYLGSLGTYDNAKDLDQERHGASLFLCSNSGTVDNISVILNAYGGTANCNATCAIYYQNLTLLAQTEVITGKGDADYNNIHYTFDFVSPPNVVSGSYYWLLVKGGADGGAFNIATNDSNGEYFWYDDYGAVWDPVAPNPLTYDWNVTNEVLCIYANITEGGEPEESWQQNFTGYWTGGNTSAWTQNFTGYWTGGNDTVSWQQNYTGYWTGGNISSWTQNFTGWWTGGNTTVSETWQQNFTGYWTGGNDSVDWNQNFSGFWTGGNATVSWKQNFTGYWTGGNGSAWRQNFTGYWTGGNATVSWNQNFTGYWTGGNVSETWQQNFTGYWTGGNITTAAFNISLEFPVNESRSTSYIQPTVYFNLTHPDGYTMNYSLYIHNTTLVYSGVNVSNGTQVHTSHLFYSANTTYETYYWRVVVNDGMGNWVNETYNFQAVLQGSILESGAGFMVGIAMACALLAIGFVLIIIRRRQRDGDY